MKQLDHIGVIVDNVEEAKGFLSEVLGLELDREFDRPDVGVKVAFFRCGSAEIEVIEVTDPEARHERLGDGARARIEHIAVRVEDLHETMETLSPLGVRVRGGASGDFKPMDEPLKVGDSFNVWTDPETCDGVMYQLVEKTSRTE